MGKIRSFFNVMFFALFPVFLNLSVTVVMFVISGYDGEMDMEIVYKSSLITMSGLVVLNLIRREKLLGDKEKEESLRASGRQLASLVIFLVSIALLINAVMNIPAVSRLVEKDKVFVETSKALSTPIPSMFFYVVLMAPIVEEYMFRRMCYTPIRRFFGKMSAIFISALFFGIFHGNIVQGIYAFVLGLILAYTYEVSNNVLWCVLGHMLANLCSVTLSYNAFGYYFKLEDNVGLWLYIGCMAAVTIFFAVIVYKNALKLKGDLEDEATEYSDTLL